MIIINANGKMGVLKGEDLKFYDSLYIQKYKDIASELSLKNEWKYGGDSAMFQGRVSPEYLDFTAYRLQSVARYKDSFVYSASCDAVSAIVEKNEDGTERNLLHTNEFQIHRMNYNPQKDAFAMSTTKGNGAFDITYFDVADNYLSTKTGGDSVDDFPFFDISGNNILFSSRGIARNNYSEIMAYSKSEIFSVNLVTNQISEIESQEGYDLVMPKQDCNGDLYFIRKPYVQHMQNLSYSLLDVLLMPFRLVMNIIKGLVFLSKIGSKSNKRNQSVTGGSVQSVQQERSEQEMFIFEQNLTVNSKNGNEGFAPENFELVKRTKEGNYEVIAKKVLSYDFDKQGNLFYTNGKVIFKNHEQYAKLKIITELSVN